MNEPTFVAKAWAVPGQAVRGGRHISQTATGLGHPQDYDTGHVLTGAQTGHDSMTNLMLARLERLRQKIAQKCDAMMILHKQNVRYLCGFTSSQGVLIVTPYDATLYVDERYAEQTTQEVSAAKVVPVARPALLHALSKAAGRFGRLSYEANHVTKAEYEQLAALLPDVQLVGLAQVVETLRSVKDEYEIDLIRRSVAITDVVFDAFCGWIEPGIMEDEVAARLEYEQRMHGGERVASGLTIVASGQRTSLPDGVASRRVIGENEPLMIDIGTTVDGYCSDLTRTIYLGKAPGEFKRIYHLVLEAQQRALDGIRPGLSGREVDALSDQVLANAGYPGGYSAKFNHTLGHAIGLDVHEQPLLASIEETSLQENMVFTVEPGIYIPGWGGVRIEDVVRVTAEGCEVLSKSTRTLVEVS